MKRSRTMWLQPIFSLVCRAAARVFYRLTLDGGAVPRSGPVLLVANHPNALFDPVLVAAAARRPVRFLAKAPLFHDKRLGFLVRGAGAIPVYRRADDPGAMDHNLDMFRAVHASLSQGDAIGVFPEGISHDEPSLQALKTGAARIALGAYAVRQEVFPIKPIGLVLGHKEAFRSRAVVVLGQEIEWEDLAPRGSADHEAVRELTGRVDAALRQVTLNLERWEDRRLVECAEAIWSAARKTKRDPRQRIGRLEVTTSVLAQLRREMREAADSSEAPGEVLTLLQEVSNHCRRLERLRLLPSDIGADVGVRRSLAWVVRRLHLVGPPAVVLAIFGVVLFWPPYQLTGVVVRFLALSENLRSTYKLLLGIVLYVVWIVLLSTVTGWIWNPWAGLVAFTLIPAIGLVGLWVRERWRGAFEDARRFFLLRSRSKLVQTLAERQRKLALRLQHAYERWDRARGP